MSVIKKQRSVLLEEEKLISLPNYSDEEENYLKGLYKKLVLARNKRDQSYQEFDGMDYSTYYTLNEKLANTYIEPKKNKEDSNFQSGTIRTKLFALLSSIINLNLSGDISAFDKNGLKVQALGDAMEDIILKTNELDIDDEKKLLRQYELLKHGSVFVEEIWDEKNKKEKKLKEKFNGQIKNVKWKTKIKKAFAKPSRNIIPGINVYLGDITKYNINEQPFIFTVDNIPYEEAKVIFEEWERWNNVPRKEKFANEIKSWRLLEVQEDYVEIIRYQDKWNNEFALLLNGVLMTPVGLPLPWGYEEYNISQQNLEPINSKFAYGKSLVFKIRNKVAILDEMMRLAILKTQKSFMPPYINISGRILSNKVLMPGKISHGIAPGTLLPINDKETQGITTAELAMINELKESVNSETTSPTFQGQQARGNPTATEVLELQRQAKQMLGIIIFAMCMLEWKLEWLRLQNILKNWFNKEDEVVDEMRNILKSVYRQTSVERPIEGEGIGRRIVIPATEIPSSEAIMKTEDILSKEQGSPIRIIFINPDEIKSSKFIWQITIIPREKRSSEIEKLLFRAEMQDAAMFGQSLNMEYLQEKFASVWGENPKKMFKIPETIQTENGTQIRESGQTISPRTNLLTAEKAMGGKIGQQLGINV